MFKASPHVTESFVKLAAGETPLELETNKSLGDHSTSTRENTKVEHISNVLYALMTDLDCNLRLVPVSIQ